MIIFFDISKKDNEFPFNYSRITSILSFDGLLWVGSGDGYVYIYRLLTKKQVPGKQKSNHENLWSVVQNTRRKLNSECLMKADDKYNSRAIYDTHESTFDLNSSTASVISSEPTVKDESAWDQQNDVFESDTEDNQKATKIQRPYRLCTKVQRKNKKNSKKLRTESHNEFIKKPKFLSSDTDMRRTTDDEDNTLSTYRPQSRRGFKQNTVKTETFFNLELLSKAKISEKPIKCLLNQK